MIWFTADTHFGHSNKHGGIIKYCNRPFSLTDEMDKTLIANWNEVVEPKDEVWHLGDFAFRCQPYYARSIFEKLNGKIHFVLGTHDKIIKQHLDWFEIESLASNIYQLVEITYEKKHIVLCHFPLSSWPKSYRDSWHLHGHRHGKGNKTFNRIDVGVDCWNYYPVSFEQIKERMLKQREVK